MCTNNGLRRSSTLNAAHTSKVSPARTLVRKRPRSAPTTANNTPYTFCRILPMRRSRAPTPTVVMSGAALVVAGLFISLSVWQISVLDAHRVQMAPLSGSLRGFIGAADSGTDGATPSLGATQNFDDEEEWTHPLIHIVNTRFMQEQAHLTHLAEARLMLFEKFCLPTVLRQSVYAFTSFDPDPASASMMTMNNSTVSATQRRTRDKDEDAASTEDSNFADPPFLWIIKVDPALEGTAILSRLVDLVGKHREVMLVGSNTNYGIGIKGGGWRGGQAGADILLAAQEGRLYSGDIDLVRRAHAARKDRVVLETRLDADDGLNILYLESLQRDALEDLFSGYEEEDEDGDSTAIELPPGTARWLYWCPLSHVAWDPTPPDEDPQTSPNATMYGTFIPWRSSKACITAGLTVGSSVGVLEGDIPRFPHQSIFERIRHPNATIWSSSNGNRHYRVANHPSSGSSIDSDAGNCGLYNRTACLRMVTHPKMGALRSRTPTSAGMKGVVTQENNKPQAHILMEERAKDPKIRASMWKVLGHYFAVTEEMATEVNTYVRDHFVDIVGDNLRGQCTKGHSCKISSKEELQRLLDLATEGKVGGVSVSETQQVMVNTS